MPIFNIANGQSASTVRAALNAKLSPIIDVKADFGAVGDNSADDTTAIQNALNAAYTLTGRGPYTGSVLNNISVFFPPGIYKITSALTINNTWGAHVFGSGRFSTTIRNASGGNVFTTMGVGYSRFELMQLITSSTGVCFDCDYDNTGASSQSNTFQDMFFEGGEYGLRLGNTGFMCSENTIINCFFANHTVAGLSPQNANSLQNQVYGGNFQGCAIGILVDASQGSVPVISGVGFQTSTDYDIKITGGSDQYAIIGCRTESLNFVDYELAVGITLIGNKQSNASSGVFIRGNGPLILHGNYSVNGQVVGITGNNGQVLGTGNGFGRSDWVSVGALNLASAMTSLINPGARMHTDANGLLDSATFASLPTADLDNYEGATAIVIDSTTATWGATIAGSGANRVLAYCNGTNWTVAGK